MKHLAVVSDQRLHILGLREADEGHLVEVEVGGEVGGVFRACHDAHRRCRVGGGDGGACQSHALVVLASDGIAAVGPFARGADDVMRWVVGATCREGEDEVLSADEVGADAQQVVAELLRHHAGLHVRASDVHDADVAFAEKDDGVHLLEEAFHGEAVAGIDDAVALEVGEVIVRHGQHQGQGLRHEQLAGQQQHYGKQRLLHYFFVAYWGL